MPPAAKADAANLITYLLIGATGICHRAAQAANLLAPESSKSPEINAPAMRLRALADPVEPKYFHKLAGTIPGEPGPTKRSPSSSHSCPKRRVKCVT